MNKSFQITISLVILLSMFIGTPTYPARAASELIVTNANSSGAGSLFQTIVDAASGDTIIFDPAVSGQTINWLGDSSGILIAKNIKIDATSVGSSITINGNMSRVFRVSQGATLEVLGITIINEPTVNTNPSGGDIWNEGNLILTNCAFLNSSVGAFGGAIYNQGNLTITNCTFSQNKAVSGGAIYSARGNIEINNSTFTSNYSEGIRIMDGMVTITNSTFYENSINSNGQLTLRNSTTRTGVLTAGGNTISGTNTGELHIFNSIIEECRISNVPIFTNSNNLIQSGTCGISALSSDPLLGAPINNGGLTQTMILFPGSPAIDSGNNDTCATTDQRGITRPQGNTCDLGAFEVSPNPVPVQAIMHRANASPTDAQNVNYTVIFSEAVTGVDTSDFKITTVTLPDAYIEAVSGSGYLYTITANTGSGNGDFRVKIIDDDSIINTNGDALGGTGISDYYYSSDSYKVNKSEINLIGNEISIVDGDITPSVDDHTDFGSADIAGGTVTRTFVIENNGSADLKLTGVPIVRIQGTHASNFSVVASPLSPIAANGETSFTILFDPSAIGLRTATISIFNDDANESFYDFNIQGTGMGPEISLTGKNVVIPDGDNTPSGTDHTDFGNTPTSNGATNHIFTISNTGNTNLNLTGTPFVSVTGTHSSDFTVTNQPSNPILPGESTTFAVDFNPSADGLRSATISIGNNDANESPYNFSIQGTGTSSPEIEIQGNNAVIIDEDITPSSADHTDFGTAEITGNTISHTFTIYNLGDSNLSLTGSPSKVLVSGAYASDFTVSAQPTSPIVPGGSTTFTITFVPGSVGARTAIVSINNNDSNENPYNFSIQGSGLDRSIFTVNAITDDNDGSCDVFEAGISDCTLREALALASNGDTINFDPALAGQSIHLASTLMIDKGITIDGSNLSPLIKISGDTDNNGTGDVTVFHVGGPSPVEINNLVITKGKATGIAGGGGIANYGTLTIKNSTISNNEYVNGLGGGGIYNKGTLTIIDSVISGNTAIEGGGILNDLNSELTISGTTFSNNSSVTEPESPGGSAGAIGNIGTLSINNCTFTNNLAFVGGGAIVNALTGNATISNSVFTGNTTYDNGGAIINTEATMIVENSTFNSNTSKGGGAIYNDGELTITGGTFTENDASFGDGGGIANLETLTLADASLSNNSASLGGGIYNSGLEITITNTTINTNTADLGGGGIANQWTGDGLMVIANSTISGNTAPNGGGIHNLSSTGTVNISDSNISNNISANHGGGITSFGPLDLNAVELSNNVAVTGNGGGILGAGPVNITNSTIQENHAGLDGGGIENADNDLTVKGTLLYKNQAGRNGGAIYVNTGDFYYGYVLLENTTITQNQAEQGGAIYADKKFSAVRIRNTTIIHNQANFGNEIRVLGAFEPHIEITDSILLCAYDTSCFTYVPLMVIVSPNTLKQSGTLESIGIAPLTNNGGPTQTMALLPGSPAINAGDNSTCTEIDQRGVTRPQGAQCDIGAYEYVDGTQPTVSSIVKASTSPTNATSVNFTVTFSEPVFNVDVSDFSLTANNITGTSVTNVTGSGSTFTVTVNTGTGDGTLRLNVKSSATILNSIGNLLNGGFFDGEIYTIDKTAPTITINNPNASSAQNKSITASTSDGTLSMSNTTGSTCDGTLTFIAYASQTFTSESDNEKKVCYKAVDALGNSSYNLSNTITGIDTTAPDTQIDTNSINNTTADFTFSSPDGTASFECSLDTAPFAACISPLQITSLTNGSHDLQVRAKDPAGNADETPASFSWTIGLVSPTISSITRTSTSPTSAASVDFTVTFSEDVQNVDADGSDFELFTTGVTGASITSVIPVSTSVYTVSVNTGSGSGTLRLDVPNTATIKDLSNNDLTGLPFTSGESYIKTAKVTLRSNGTNDGWILESTETSSLGGTLNSTANTFNLGDDATDKQYRAILHFDTSSLPDNAVITSAILQLKQQGLSGSNPFSILGPLRVDARRPSFGTAALQLADFSSTAARNNIATFNTTPVNNWYSGTFSATGQNYINKTGTTQFRVYFTTDDNNDNGIDIIKFFSGNAAAGARPKLAIQYYVP